MPDAIRRWLNSGKPAHGVAAWLGINADRLRAPNAQRPPAAQAAQDSLAQTHSNADLRSQLDAARKELRCVSEPRDIQKSGGHSHRPQAERFQPIHAMKRLNALEALCGTLGVSRCGYHDTPDSGQRAGKPTFEDAPISSGITRIAASLRSTTSSTCTGRPRPRSAGPAG